MAIMSESISKFSIENEAPRVGFSRSRTRRDLFVSLALLGLIIVLALGGLAYDGNWRKFLRVSLALLTYISVLMFLTRLATSALKKPALPFWIFAFAAGAAEAASGWLRPDWRLSDTLVMPLAAALLIGGFHWFVLRTWRPVRRRIGLGKL
jgi:hypothetical protein